MTDILFLSTSLSGGGAERVSVNLTASWASSGFDVVYVTIASRRHDVYRLHSGINRVSFDLDGESTGLRYTLVNNFRKVRKLRQLIKAAKPKVLVGFMTSNNIILILASLGLGIRVVVSERTHPPKLIESRLWKVLRKYLYIFADEVTVMAGEGKTWIEQNTTARTVSVIPNWVSWPLQINDPVLSPESRLDPERHYILACGGPFQVKGHDVLLEAFARISDKYPDWDIVFVGAGLDQVVVEFAARHAIDHRCHCVGHVGNIGDWYSRASLFVSASRFEGFPNALLEAMASGCAVISSDCDTGPRDLIENNVNGLLVATGDVSAMSDALEHVVGSESIRSSMAAKALLVRDKYSESNISSLWDHVLWKSS